MVCRLITSFLVGLALIALATAGAIAQGLPTSMHEAKGKPWTIMHPNSFPRTTEAAIAGCQAAASMDSSDTLTIEKCTRFGELLESEGECKKVEVPNKEGSKGIVLDFLVYKDPGSGMMLVQSRALKDIRDADKHEALLCNLGDGVWSYYFNGINGCNNPAFVLVDPKPEPIMRVQCQREYFGRDPDVTQQYLPGFIAGGCRCGGGYLVPGLLLKSRDSITSRGYSETCTFVPNPN